MSTLDPGRLTRALRRLYSKSERRAAIQMTITGPVQSLLAYRHDPVGFARDVLGVELTPDQQKIINSLPGRTKVNSGHSVGKTFCAAVTTLWWVYTRDPGVVITTAPTERDVIDLLWTEVRLLHQNARIELPDYFIGPRAAEMHHHENHWAKGYTARKGESFQGRHRPSMLFVFDECEGIDAVYWNVTDTMYQPDNDHGWFAIGNPVTTSSQSYIEDSAHGPDGNPKWNLFTLSALNHPNVLAELRGEPPPVPNAVTLGQVGQWLADWATRLAPGDIPGDNDVEWPPASGIWYRPSASFLARVMGIRPTDGVDTVWGSRTFDNACKPRWTPHQCWMQNYGITIGVDVATYGDDSSTFHVRSGPLSLQHESRSGWMPDESAGFIKDLCRTWAAWYNNQAVLDRPPLRPSGVAVTIELDGPGAGVISHCNGFGNWGGLKVAEASEQLDSMGTIMYANKRAEMWFEGAKAARGGQMDLSRLPPDVLNRLKKQLTAPSYKLLPSGAMQVEAKLDVKKRIKRSPDDADGLLVSYFPGTVWMPSVILADPDVEPWVFRG